MDKGMQIARTVERALDQAPMLTDDELEIHANRNTGPFTPGLRVCCPIVTFAQRKTEHCKGCVFFGGSATRIIHDPSSNEDDPRFAATKYLIVCAHPTARSLKYFPED
ncbi:hypothetical protein LCGC14_2325330 [marine sediment metagenome]|uniref:Uncharacterized protein n=1 Tax=marine sediment metagenome TaxID=412755 RepID=A0A0F9D441_9ZZZZ